VDVYVVDTGEQEIYVLAETEIEAAEKVAHMGYNVNYAEWFSTDKDDADQWFIDAETHYS